MLPDLVETVYVKMQSHLIFVCHAYLLFKQHEQLFMYRHFLFRYDKVFHYRYILSVCESIVVVNVTKVLKTVWACEVDCVSTELCCKTLDHCCLLSGFSRKSNLLSNEPQLKTFFTRMSLGSLFFFYTLCVESLKMAKADPLCILIGLLSQNIP